MVLNLYLYGVLISGHYSALARLINLLRRAGKLDECSKYIEQVCREFPVIRLMHDRFFFFHLWFLLAED